MASESGPPLDFSLTGNCKFMGAPKQKWTAEEEAALKAGIAKHGAGKWRTILRDPEFSEILSLRSNVDLKDKWRNMNVMASGSGSREKVKVSNKRSRSVAKLEDEDMTDEMALSMDLTGDISDDVVDVAPLATTSSEPSRLDHIIIDTIKTLKEPSGSQKTTIAEYIEENYYAPPDFKDLLSTKLKALTSSGQLIKVKRKYRIAPYSIERRSSKMLLLEGAGSHKEEPQSGSDKEDVRIKVLTRDEVDSELLRIWTMDKEAATAATMRAVAEAEAIMAEAEAAAKEAEAAEVEAEAAQAFADAANKNIKNRNAMKFVISRC
ncbi:telomere repeat binding factor 1 [Rhynchospora pubera]|uniref:Telomere repeat binding factor 1 n=1 Tax=Rhynchospora pubera TaxID=906938 RepID=A0AAV8E534_9POAL|nr:telomere repeat binding factor 1 [Rhynchospora pubera]